MARSFFVALFLLSAASAADAATLKYEYSTTVTMVNSDLASQFSVGDAVLLSFQVETDPATTGPTGAAGERAAYSLSDISLRVGSYTAASSLGIITVTNNGDFGNPAVDVNDSLFLIVSGSNWSSASAVNGYPAGNFVIRHETRGVPPISTLSSVNLEDALSAGFSSASANLQFDGFRNVFMGRGEFTVVPVPLPATGLLLLGACGGLFVARKSRRRSS